MAGDDKQIADGESERTNLDRLDHHLKEGGLAKNLLTAYREAIGKDADPSASLRKAISNRLAELKGQDARGQDQQD